MKFRLQESIEYDSEGNPLSEEQVKFFKDSKVRDSQGRLLVCYHGAKNGGFNVFDARSINSQFGKYKFGRNIVNFFTTSKDTALGYTDIGVEEDGNVYSVYLNIVNPYILTSEAVEDIVPKSWNNIKNKQIRDRQIQLFDKFWKRWKWTDDEDEDTIEDINDDLVVFNCELRKNGIDFDLVKLEENTKFGKERAIFQGYSIEELFDPYMYDEMKEAIIGEDEDDYFLTTNDIVRHVLDMNKREGTDYDGIIVKDIIDVGPTGSPWLSLPQNTIITIEDSNQIKVTTNKNPTNSDNINESIISNTIDDEIKWLEDYFGAKETLVRGASYITPSGKFLDIENYTGKYRQTRGKNLGKFDFPTHDVVHNQIKKHYSKSTEDYLQVDTIGGLPFIRINDGHYENVTPYIDAGERDMPVTSDQWDSLEMWIDNLEKNKDFIDVTVGYRSNRYKLGDGVDGRYIVNRIKRCKSSGVLYESTKTNLTNSDNINEKKK